MENLRILADSYSVYESDCSCVEEVAEFIVKENYGHHWSQYTTDDALSKEISSVYAEERMHLNSQFYLARTHQGNLIGSIRVFKWNGRDVLPIERIFHINPLKKIGTGKNYSYWHVGRLAIKQHAGFSTLTLFKELMALAICPVVHDKYGYMIAETDCKLLRVMNMLGIHTTIVGEPMVHLASMTVPIFSSRTDLTPYYNKVMHENHLNRSSNLHTKVWNLNPMRDKYTFVL